MRKPVLYPVRNRVPLGKILVVGTGNSIRIIRSGKPYTMADEESGQFWFTSGKDIIVPKGKVFCHRLATGPGVEFLNAGARVTREQLTQGQLLDIHRNEIPAGTMHVAYNLSTRSLVATSSRFVLDAIEFGRGELVPLEDLAPYLDAL
jgi:hypothetical protein